jgi:(p)ppGpp synthase/HD superfamily hydrolase
MDIRQRLRYENIQKMQQGLRNKIELKFDEIEEIFEDTKEDNYEIIIPEITRIFRNENFELDEKVFQKGLKFAINTHLGQYRDSGIPYVSHPVQVAYLTEVFRRPQTTTISALLHDVIEEDEEKQNQTKQQIQKMFGYGIIETIDALTTFEEDREIRDEKHAKKIINQAKKQGNHEILYIKVADAITNLYTKKHMQPKGGFTAKERQRIYSENIQKNVLPFARYIDRQDEQELRLVKYINDLVKR